MNTGLSGVHAAAPLLYFQYTVFMGPGLRSAKPG
jgi:hypothetical protein